MTNLPFQYDESLLSLCASSGLAAFVSKSPFDGIIESGDEACRTLFGQHASHYGRSFMENDTFTPLKGGEYVLSRRMHRFVSNAVLVHQHNRKLESKESFALHEIALNQFSDMEEHELPLSFSEEMAALDSVWHGDYDGYVENLYNGMPTSFVRLEDEKSILDVATEFTTLGSSHKKRRKGKHHHHDDGAFIPAYSDNIYPSLKVAEDLDVNDFSDMENGKQSNDPYGDERVDENFDTYLNWATRDNPDGVRIVHPVMDQGTCGSCWAFAATGTLEASASRRAAYQSFTTVMQNNPPKGDGELRDHAVSVAQETERMTISACNLSVQELVDCDTAVDQGCTGGNPLLAFYFIHRFGLTSWENYPYIGEEGSCRAHRVAQPIATVQSWGILTPNHESNMELVLRYIGPIAVGVNGADPTFLSYKGGIFDSENCGQAANHAMLIVGLGEEINSKNGSKIKYWIARNTWGTGWGEDGYVRVKRGDGTKGQAGVCGLAKNPSVALGGTLLEATNFAPSSTLEEYMRRGRSPQLERSQLYASCNGLRFGEKMDFGLRIQCMLEYHRAFLFGAASMIIVALFVVWPLATGCRIRRRRRHRKRQRRSEATVSQLEEGSPLVESDHSPPRYGSNN